jgi:hypothetical protein
MNSKIRWSYMYPYWGCGIRPRWSGLKIADWSACPFVQPHLYSLPTRGSFTANDLDAQSDDCLSSIRAPGDHWDTKTFPRPCHALGW